MGKCAKWTAIVFSVIWLFASARWAGDLNWEGRPLWGILFIGGLAAIWLAAAYFDGRSESLTGDLAIMKHWGRTLGTAMN